MSFHAGPRAQFPVSSAHSASRSARRPLDPNKLEALGQERLARGRVVQGLPALEVRRYFSTGSRFTCSRVLDHAGPETDH